MALFLEGIACEDLDRLAPRDLEGLSLIKLKDPENLTTEQVQRLRDRLYGKSRPVDAKNLQERLSNISRKSSSRSSPSRSASPSSSPSSRSTPSVSVGERECEAAAKEAYSALLLMGGRPSRVIRLEPGVWSPSGASEHLHVFSHWLRESTLFGEELDRWKAFREYQQRVRETPQRFLEWQETVTHCRQIYGLEGDVVLCMQAERQSKLDDWKEFQTYWRSKSRLRLRRFETKLKDAQEALQSVQRRWEEAKLDECKGYWEREGIKESVEIHHGRLRHAELNLERETAMLEWITGQLPVIATEMATSNLDGKKDVHYHEEQVEPPKMMLTSPTIREVPKPQDSVTSSRRYPNRNDRAISASTLDQGHPSRVAKSYKGKAAPRFQGRCINRSIGLAPGSHIDNQGFRPRDEAKPPTPGFVLRTSKRIPGLHANGASQPLAGKLLETTRPSRASRWMIVRSGEPSPTPGELVARGKGRGKAGTVAAAALLKSDSEEASTGAPRRSARIAERRKRLGALASGLGSKDAHTTMDAQAESVQPTQVKSNAANSGKPRGILKKHNRKSAPRRKTSKR